MRALSFRRRRGATAPRARTGFSVIEVMVAVTLLGVVMMSLGKLSVVIAQRGRSNELVTERTFAMQQQASKFVSMPYDSIATFPTVGKTFMSGDFRYGRLLRITSPGTDRYRITLVIVPASDPARRDSVIIDRSRPPSSSVLCVGCP